MTLDALATRLIEDRPEDPVPHIVQMLEDMKGIGAPPLTPQERLELDQLRSQHKDLTQRLSKPAKKAAAESDSSDSECEEVADLPIMKPTGAGAPKARTSVSAEVYGRFNAKQAFTPKVIPKSAAVKAK